MIKNQFAQLCSECIIHYGVTRFGGGLAWLSRSNGKCTMCQKHGLLRSYLMIYRFDSPKSTVMAYSLYPLDYGGFYVAWFGKDS